MTHVPRDDWIVSRQDLQADPIFPQSVDGRRDVRIRGEQPSHEVVGMGLSQGIQRHGDVGGQPRPARLGVEELLASQREHEYWRVGEPRGERGDELEQALVGPMQVFEQEQGWPLARECLQEALG